MSKILFKTFLISFLFFSLLFFLNLMKEKEVEIKVIDGDTLILNGEEIRLLGINAPERGERCYEASKQKLIELLGKEIKLEVDLEDKDRYGRLLRYVFSEGKLVNLVMVREGYALAFEINGLKYEEEFKKAEELARKEGKGCLWGKLRNWCRECIKIEEFHFNAKGDDRKNLNDEFVVFRNVCEYSCNLTNWLIKDRAEHTFVFPEFLLPPNSSFTLFTGCGNSSQTKLFWCSKFPIWNNDGDTLFLYDDKNAFILAYSY